MNMGGRGFIRESLLQEKTNGRVRCHVCERRCAMGEGGLGWCRTRYHHSGKLYTLVYGAVSSLSANPIEKKPLYHFHPGTFALTAGSFSCNFGCDWCQNADISKVPPLPAQCILAWKRGGEGQPQRDTALRFLDCVHQGCHRCQNWGLGKGGGRYMSPEDFVAETIKRGCQGTSISFNEPTLSLEWSLDIFPLAREKGLYNTYVTNGYMTEKALDLLIGAGLEAMNVDIKGNAEAVKKHCGADVEKVWRTCRRAVEAGVWVEITTLVIPTVNDDEETLGRIASRIRRELGQEVPWHLSAYYPAYKFLAPPTSAKTLERAHDIGKQEGLAYIYVGNLPGHPYEHTYCPGCGQLLIERQQRTFVFGVRRYKVEDGHCPDCGLAIPIVGEKVGG